MLYYELLFTFLIKSTVLGFSH